MMGFHCERVSMCTFFARFLRLIAAESELRLQFLSAAFRERRKNSLFHSEAPARRVDSNVRDEKRGWLSIMRAER